MSEKLTEAQRRLLGSIARISSGGKPATPYDVGYPSWPIVGRLKDAGLIEVIGEGWPLHSAREYRITPAGRLALEQDGGER